MFSGKDLKVKLVYMGFGGMIAIIGMLFAIGMLSSVTAQRDKFGEIECTKLRVVDTDGNSVVSVEGDRFSGGVKVFDKDGALKALLSGSELTGGGLGIYGKNRKVMVILSAHEHGGNVCAYGTDGKSRASLGIVEDGGVVQVKGEGEGESVMGINEYGDGMVSTWDKNGYLQ